jgi:NADPH:quinone reductase-like Zn-dependent oxidoreductase
MGVVTAVGEGVTGLSPGQRVTAMGWQANQGQGSWQQYVNIKAELVVSGPQDLIHWSSHLTAIMQRCSCPLPRPGGHHLGFLKQQLEILFC